MTPQKETTQMTISEWQLFRMSRKVSVQVMSFPEQLESDPDVTYHPTGTRFNHSLACFLYIDLSSV